MRLYLAHPFDSRHEIRDWELQIERMTDIELINPFFDIDRPDKELINDKGKALSSDATREERYELNDGGVAAIVERDLLQIRQSDGIIAVIDGSLSYGTIQEMVYAKVYDKICYVMISNGQEGHPWIRYHATKIFTSLVDLADYLME